MLSNHKEKLKNLFNVATELEYSKREDFLDKACGEDLELRSELENLLASFDAADSFLEDSAIGEVVSLIIENKRKLEQGQKVGFYEIISNIGTGGMGEVYLANDSRLNRRIALKILPAEFTRDEMRLKRFRLEAQTASALNHPNIITIYEIGDFEETNYIATEFVEGETLREKISSGNLHPIEVLDIAVQIASGLSVAHRANVVHRDIKPENIMIRPDGIVKILDFGLAKLTETRGRGDAGTRRENNHDESLAATPNLRVSASLTNPGTIMGTVNYMSPEQADGSMIDGRTDLWSLGVCLYEIFTGKLPFAGKTLNHTLVAIMENEPREFEPVNSFGAVDVREVIDKLLRKTPDKRYKSAGQLAEDLRGIKRKLQNLSEEKESVSNRKTAAESPRVQSIAVLPFLTFGLQEDEEYLGIGLADSLIMQLSKAKELEVRPTNAVRNFANAERDIDEIGRNLNVGSVLEGNLQKLGERLRVSVQLVETNSQKTIWADKFNADLIDLFDLQDTIAEKVSESLLLSLNTIEQEKFSKPQTDSKAAYLEYLKGRYYWDKRNVEAVKQAVEQFKKAIDLDPTYALAYTGLADAYTMLGIWGEFPPDEIFPRAKAAAERALQIDETLAEAYASISRVKYSYERDWEGVESYLKKAIELNPNYSVAYGRLGTFYSLMHRHDETVEVLKQARQLDPLSRQTSASLASSYYFARKFETAIEKLKDVLAIHPNYLSAVFMLAVSYARNGQFAEAIETGQRAVEISNGHLVIKGYQAIIYILAGEKEKGLELLKELEEKVSENKTLNYSIAAIYAQLNEKEKAYEWLEKCFEKGDANIHSIVIDIEFDNLRNDERFRQMLKRLDLEHLYKIDK